MLQAEHTPAGDELARTLLHAALADCDAAIAADASEFAAHFDRGGVLQRLGDVDGALAAFREAADLAPGIPGYRLREGELRFEAGDAPGAARVIRGVARRAPTYAEARAALAAVCWATGDVGGAEGALGAAVDLDPAWARPGHAAAATRFPPKLLAAYERLLRIEA